jgi:hypothetical protein
MSKYKDPIHIFGFGRLGIEDERDLDYPMGEVLPDEDSEKYSIEEKDYQYWWQSAWWGNQGFTPQCVSYSWRHWLEDGPETHFYEDREIDPEWMNTSSGETLVDCEKLYNKAQERDRWPGTDYNGTSVRAGAKVLQDEGLIDSYHWAWKVEPVVEALLHKGPVVVGTRWYRGMYEPNEEDIIEVDGEMVGGHAYVLNGVNLNKGLIRLKNSWGRDWGDDGYAYISIEDMDKLIREGGEACLAIEKKYEDFDKESGLD